MDSIYKKIIEAAQSGKSAALCVVTNIKGSAPGKPGMKMLVYDDGTITGTVGGGAIEKDVIEKALEAMKNGMTKHFSFNLKADLNMECGGSAEVYIEPVNQAKKLYIFGAGHIGKALSDFAYKLGFDVTVIDERTEIFNAYDPNIVKCVNKHFAEAVGELTYDKQSFFVIVTHKHIHDYDILKLLCNKTYAYLGMIGSKTKVEKIKNELLESGFTTADTIAKIDAPIGIRFRAITPEEIAVSILAKLIDVRNTPE